VLGRFIDVMDVYGLQDHEAVVRLTADCPLVDPEVVDRVVREFASSRADYCSNTMLPTYPDGLDVEVVNSGALRQVNRETDDVHEREHVTLGVYRRFQRFQIRNVVAAEDLSHLRWTVDTQEDYEFVSRVYSALYEKCPKFTTRDILEYIQREAISSKGTVEARRNSALLGLDTGAMHMDIDHEMPTDD